MVRSARMFERPMGVAMMMSRLTAFARSAVLTVLAIALALSAGCAQCVACYIGWNVHSRPSNDGLRDGYEDGAVYELRQDVFIMASDSSIKRKEGYLVPPSTKAPPRKFSSPPTIESWEKGLINLDRWNGEWARTNDYPDAERIIGIVRQGTHVNFMYMNGFISLSVWFGYSRYDSPFAKILDGEYADWDVDIADISNWCPEMHVDKRFLRKVDR